MSSIIYIVIFCAPLAAFAVDQHIITPEEIGSVYAGRDKDRLQVIVPDQFEIAGSSTDCGYHSLYNGLSIASLARATEHGLAGCLSRLGSTEDSNHMRLQAFGSSETDWRKQVMEIRADKEASKQIGATLLKGVDIAKFSEMEIEAIKNIVRNSSSNLAQASRESHLSSIHYNVLPELLEEELMRAVQAKLSDDSVSEEMRTIYKSMKSAIDSFIKLEEITITVAPDDASWLSAEEIRKLSSLDATFDLFGIQLDKSNLFILGDSHDINQPIDVDSVSERDEFKKLQKRIHDPESNVLAVILIYTNDSADFFSWLPSLPSWSSSATIADEVASATSSSSKGHWFTLVVNKVGNQTQFITADSGGNKIRLQDKRVNQVITLLTEKQSKAKPTFTRSPWRRWQKPLKIIGTAVAMTAACLLLAKKWNQKKSVKQKESA